MTKTDGLGLTNGGWQHYVFPPHVFGLTYNMEAKIIIVQLTKVYKGLYSSN
jgi:hypothetical protein